MSSFVAGIMLGALLAGTYFIGNGSLFPLLSTPNSALDTIDTRLSTETSGAVKVVDQSAGDVVTIESLIVPPPGVWVAVREVQGTTLTNVLGAARMNGPGNNFPVSLLRATIPNQAYAVQLYRDDENNTFDPAINSVYVDFDTGTPVIAYFRTTL